MFFKEQFSKIFKNFRYSDSNFKNVFECLVLRVNKMHIYCNYSVVNKSIFFKFTNDVVYTCTL